MLKVASEKKAVLESQLQTYDIRVQEISAELVKSNQLLQNQQELKRNIEDNLNYRRTTQKIDELTSEINLIEEKIVKMGGLSKFEIELYKLKQERDRFSSEVCIICSNLCHVTLSFHCESSSKFWILVKFCSQTSALVQFRCIKATFRKTKLILNKHSTRTLTSVILIKWSSSRWSTTFDEIFLIAQFWFWW